MVREIVIPEIILEEIVSDGIEEGLRSAEASGVLIGVYDGSIDRILISERRRKAPRITFHTDEPDLANLIHRLMYIPIKLYAMIAVMKNDRRTRRMGLTPAIVTYHTQESDEWPQRDENRAREYNNHLSKADIKYARLLYSFEQEKPFVRDGYGINIPVIINKT